TRYSAGTTRPASTSSNASTARGFGPPSPSSRPARTARTGPRTPSSSNRTPISPGAAQPGAHAHRQPSAPPLATSTNSSPASKPGIRHDHHTQLLVAAAETRTLMRAAHALSPASSVGPPFGVFYPEHAGKRHAW